MVHLMLLWVFLFLFFPNRNNLLASITLFIARLSPSRGAISGTRETLMHHSSSVSIYRQS